MVEPLIDILGKEAALFESFLELLERQQKALVANDTDELDRITELQREKMTESRILNRQREEVVAQIKSANAIDGDVNVSRLLEIVDENQAAQLEKLRQLILNLTDKITRTRNRNAMLLNRSREYIARTMEMLSRCHTPGGVYSASGDEDKQVGQVAVDRRV
ncbi:MAG: flagellar protein FlgN [Candidatus Zixiibacteriota bacterium]